MNHNTNNNEGRSEMNKTNRGCSHITSSILMGILLLSTVHAAHKDSKAFITKMDDGAFNVASEVSFFLSQKTPAEAQLGTCAALVHYLSSSTYSCEAESIVFGANVY